MRTVYDPDLKAHVSLDDNGQVRHIRHSQEYWESEESIPRLSANGYLNQMAPTLRISQEEFRNLNKPLSFFEPREQGVEYQLSEEKHLFDSTTLGYAQTYLNVPVWRRGISVEIKQNPNRVVALTNNSESDLRGRLPDDEAIGRYRRLCQAVTAQNAVRNSRLERDSGESQQEDETVAFLNTLLGEERSRQRTGSVRDAHQQTRVMSSKFFVYKYDPEKRYAGEPTPGDSSRLRQRAEEDQEIVPPKLPPVADSIQPGQAYLVTEIIFTSDAPGFNGLAWLILVEVETSAILYIECMTCGVNGLVFRRDPMVKTGDLTITADDPNGTLNPQRDDVVLTNLDAPVGGTQHLRGTYVDIEELTISHADPDIAPPTRPSGNDFDYDARTNNFGAVNAYYHLTELFKTIESLGFPIATYFDGTTFPIPVDHRSLANVINAHWSPNGTGGTDHMCFALCDLSNTTDPLLRAVDPWVHWHEMGGHGTLGDHVGSGNLGFSHSAGDGLAAIQMDPDSALRSVPERFRYAPFRPFTTERRFDRPVTTWAWGSANDDGGYGSEQILATCHFRLYRSIGGDHSSLGRRQFAARVATYLILRTIGNLTPGTNPSDPQIWCEKMQDTDLQNWTSEGLSGGAYNKVIRWAFEQQGCYQPVGAPSPVTTPGAPPEVDVYIDDGRAGAYQFQAVHWQNMSMWNRNSPDGLVGHQNAIEGATNYMYCKVKNRGTSTATNVTVRSYHSLPGAGLTWPNDFVEMSPAGGLPIASIGLNSSQEITVGPFEWTPNINTYGHDCVLMIASAPGDPSNVANFTGAETVAEWRLVPNDNNIGQRNVTVMPGGGGEDALVAALDGAFFMAGNTLNRAATMDLRVHLPRVLAANGWRLEFAGIDGNRFQLAAGQKRKIVLRLIRGRSFSAVEVRQADDRDIVVSLYQNDALIGGMTYQLDPDLTRPSGGKQPSVDQQSPGDRQWPATRSGCLLMAALAVLLGWLWRRQQRAIKRG